jgi:DNA modification methylase
METVNIEELVQDQHNFNKGTEEGARLMEKSFTELGAGRSILIDKDGHIIAGNKSQKAAMAAGIKKVRVIESDGTELIAVKRTDISIDSKEGRELALADNLTTQVNLAWDNVELASVAAEQGIDLPDWGLDPKDLGIEEPTETKEAQEDDFDEEKDKVETVCKKGDIWQLGNHRLMCGDSTLPEDVARLMDGEKAELALTDPPYGVAVVQKNHVGASNVAEVGTYAPIVGDETTDTARKSYDIMKDVSDNQIIFGGNYFTDFLCPKACWLIWDKENTGNFADVELAWTSFDKGAKLYRWQWNGMVRRGDRATELVKRVHPTQKPVGMLGDILKDFSKENDGVLDLFGGSGSTLIACEQLGRKCYMMELDPHYCDVIIARWEKLTGQKATKL